MNARTPTTASVDPSERAARRGAQIAQLLFLALSCVFVASSTWQFARAVFITGDEAPPTTVIRPSPCTEPPQP
jgi:hypothetical protein